MTKTGTSRPQIWFAHRLLRARDWQDRPELDRLVDWWRQRRAGVCALVGIGGAGKTAIVDRLLRLLPNVLSEEPGLAKDPSLPTPRELFVFSFYDAPNPDAFFAEFEVTLDPREAAIREQERKFTHVAERYHEALSRSDPATLALLERVCLFRLGVDVKTLVSIFTGGGKEEISGPALARLKEKQVQVGLDLLVEMKLLERSEREGRGPGVGGSELYMVHPAVRDGFLRRLDAGTCQRVHWAARERLNATLGGRSGPNPSDPAILDLLEEIVYHTLEAGYASEAWGIYEYRIGNYENLGGRLGAYERGERICRGFAGGRSPETAPLSEGLSEADQPSLLNDWALYLKELGRLDGAGHCYERQIEMRLRQGEWKNASTGSQNLAEVLIAAGRLTAALRAGDQAIQFTERSGGAAERMRSHGYRGHARALRGVPGGALTDFRAALAAQSRRPA